MNDFIYVPVEESETELTEDGFLRENYLCVYKAFDVFIDGPPTDNKAIYLKKVPVLEYLKSISPIQEHVNKIQISVRDVESHDPDKKAIQEDWKEGFEKDFNEWVEDEFDPVNYDYPAYYKYGARAAIKWAKQYIEENIINKTT